MEPLRPDLLGCGGRHRGVAFGIVGVYPTYYASFLAMIIGPLLHVALTAATKGRYYQPAQDASANRVGGH